MPTQEWLLLLEVAVLLVSLKIIWMIHKQSKVDHFQFWILNSIEFQMNMLTRRIAEMTEAIHNVDNTPVRGSSEEKPSSGEKQS